MINQEQIKEMNTIHMYMSELNKSSATIVNLDTDMVQELIIESVDLKHKTEDGDLIIQVISNSDILQGSYNIFITTKVINFETVQHMFDKEIVLKGVKVTEVNKNSFIIDKDSIKGEIVYIPVK